MKCPKCGSHLPEMDRPEAHIPDGEICEFYCDACGQNLQARWDGDEPLLTLDGDCTDYRHK